MKRSIIFVCLAVSCAAAGVWSQLTHAVRLDYLIENKGALKFALPLEIPLPKYDFELVRANLQGSVEAKFVIDASGAVRDLVITQATLKEFEAAAKEAVVKWRFRPLKKDVARSGSIECKFTFTAGE